VSDDEIERLLEERSLVRQSADDEQVAGYWAKAASSFADSQTKGISSDGAFQLAYTAALQATLAVLAAHGLRVRAADNHFKTFYTLQKLNATLRSHGLAFDGLRQTRHQSVYEPEHDEQVMQRRLERALAALRSAFPVLRAEIVSVRPGLDGLLPTIVR
jgi:hypothetical protein